MASQQSSSYGSRSRSIGSNPPAVMCYHHELAPLRTVKFNGITKGRRFFGCSHWPRTCGFFKWADEVDDVNELQMKLLENDTIIAELELQKDELEKKVKNLKEERGKLEEQCTELAIQNSETMIAITSVRADKKLAIALIISWVFFSLVFLKQGRLIGRAKRPTTQGLNMYRAPKFLHNIRKKKCIAYFSHLTKYIRCYLSGLICNEQGSYHQKYLL